MSKQTWRFQMTECQSMRRRTELWTPLDLIPYRGIFWKVYSRHNRSNPVCQRGVDDSLPHTGHRCRPPAIILEPARPLVDAPFRRSVHMQPSESAFSVPTRVVCLSSLWLSFRHSLIRPGPVYDSRCARKTHLEISMCMATRKFTRI